MISYFGSITVPGLEHITVFRDDEDSNQFYALPSTPRLARDDKGNLLLDLMIYARDVDKLKPEDLEAATNAMVAIRPNVRYFDTQRMIGDLANGEICLAVGYNGDILQARDRAEENKTGQEIAYSIPFKYVTSRNRSF